MLVILFFRRIASILCVTVTIAALSEELCSTGSLSSEEEVEFIKRSDSLAMRNKRAIKRNRGHFKQQPNRFAFSNSKTHENAWKNDYIRGFKMLFPPKDGGGR